MALTVVGDTCDSLFGPVISQHDCRGGFDFTGTYLQCLGAWAVSTYTDMEASSIRSMDIQHYPSSLFSPAVTHSPVPAI